MIKIIFEDKQNYIGETITVGIYGDGSPDNFLSDYENLNDFISKCKKNGLTVSDLDDNGEYGWSMNLTGDSKTIYKMVNYKILGYNEDSLEDFMNNYMLD